MKSQVEEIKQAIREHCSETGIEFNDFVSFYLHQVQEPDVFDLFFEYPFDQISPEEQNRRIDIIIDALTT